MDLEQIYTEIILEHNRDTRNKRQLEQFTVSEHGHNPSCGDDLTLELNIVDNVIEDAAYTGMGCAISQASASMMIDLILGKTVEEAMEVVNTFLGMITKDIVDDELLEEVLEDAVALKNISNMPARVKCAVLAWHTLKQALQ